jgi:hypothetical protein
LTKREIAVLLVRHTKNLVESIEAARSGKLTVDIFVLLHRYATDVIAEFTYGPHGATNSLKDETYRHVAEEFAFSNRRVFQLCQIYIPRLMYTWVSLTNLIRTKDGIGVFEYGWQAVQRAKSNPSNDPEESLASLMTSNKNETFSDAYIASELIDHMVGIPDRPWLKGVDCRK